jgi:hypothetical protein
VTSADDATIVCVVYPRTKAGDHFDHIYYVNRHLALVRSLWSDTGLDEVTSARGVRRRVCADLCDHLAAIRVSGSLSGGDGR